MNLGDSAGYVGRPCGLLLATILLVLASPAAAQTGRGYTLVSSTLDSGGGTMAEGGEYEAAGSSGRTDAATTAGGDYSETGGFWSGTIESVTVNAPSPRYLSITPSAGIDSIALWLTGDPLDPAVSCVSLYVQPDGTLGVDPVFLLPEEWGTVYVRDGLITPRGAFRVEAEVFDAGDPPVRSTPSSARAAAWGDLNEDALVDGRDLLIFVDAYLGNKPYWRGDLCPEIPDASVDGDDLLYWIDAFYGESYPFSWCGGARRGPDRDDPRRLSTSLDDETARLSLSPATHWARPKEPVAVEVSLEGVSNLRAFQVAMDASGGDSGSLILEKVFIDETREDFIFAQQSPLTIADQKRQRTVAALWQGGVSAVDEQRYLATFVFVPTRDAKGAFSLTLRDEPGTMLRDPHRRPLLVSETARATIYIGHEQPTPESLPMRRTAAECP